jgi:hypothetical protein
MKKSNDKTKYGLTFGDLGIFRKYFQNEKFYRSLAQVIFKLVLQHNERIYLQKMFNKRNFNMYNKMFIKHTPLGFPKGNTKIFTSDNDTRVNTGDINPFLIVNFKVLH